MKRRNTLAAVSLALGALSALTAGAPQVPPDFKGTIKLDVRDSTPDWGPYTPTKAPAGAPNVLIVL